MSPTQMMSPQPLQSTTYARNYRLSRSRSVPRGRHPAAPILLLHKRGRQLDGRRDPDQSSAELSRLAAVNLLGKSALLVLGSVDGISPYSSLLSSCPPVRGRELSSREAVLPLMYRVREDGLQTGRHKACKSSVSFPKIPSGLDSHCKAESSHH
jgi:hypothetical protein